MHPRPIALRSNHFRRKREINPISLRVAAIVPIATSEVAVGTTAATLQLATTNGRRNLSLATDGHEWTQIQNQFCTSLSEVCDLQREILLDVTESERLRAGDILVTRQTDPGWGPIFPLISGLVIERGGMLSHGAIIAREFGIPSVVGVKDATRLIQHGSSITVDGDRGLVVVGGAR